MHAVVRRLLLVAPVVTMAVEFGWATPTLPARLDFTPLSTAQASDRIENAAVELVVLGCDLGLRQGTGVVVAPDMIVTNDHVVGAFRSVDVAGVESPTVPTAAVTSSQNADIAVVRTEGLGAAPLSLAAHDPEPGAVVTIGGFPHDPMRGELPGGLMVEPAHVVDYVDGQPMGQPGAVMRLDVPVGQGMSGGAVLDSRGDLAGVLFAVQRPTNEALALPASLVRTALSPPASVPLVTKRC